VPKQIEVKIGSFFRGWLIHGAFCSLAHGSESGLFGKQGF
jgi:hypothetical protein